VGLRRDSNLVEYVITSSLFSVVEDTNDVAAAGLRLEPSALGRHNQVGVCHIKKLVDTDGVHREGSQAILVAAADKTLQASAATNEVDGGACTHILDSEDVP